MLHEISRQIIYSSKNDDILLSWHNSVLAVRTENGIQFFNFSSNLECFDKNLDFQVSFLPSPKSSPATDLFSSSHLMKTLRNVDITQMVIDPGFWPHNAQLSEEMANIAFFEWSPESNIHNECVIAVLNNIGNIEMFVQQRCEWESVLNLSSVIQNHYESQGMTTPKSYEQLKKAVNKLETSAIKWGPTVSNKSYYFVTGQRNGKVLIWLLKCEESVIKAELQCEIKTSIGEIISILWIPQSEEKFFLVCSNSIGEITAVDCEIKQSLIQPLKQTGLWTHKDKMVAKYLHYTIIDGKNIILYNKYRYLLVQMVDENCKIISQIANNVNDYKITDIKKGSDGFYLTTVNCKVYKINLIFLDGKLNVNLSLIETKEPYPTFELYNFSISQNNLIWVLAMVDKKMIVRKKTENIDLIFLSSNMQHDAELSLLLNNPTKKLKNLWDCIVLLRYKTMKLKCLPPTDYIQLYGDGSNDMYKMKRYLILAILYDSLERIGRNNSKGLLPETSLDKIREQIYILQARNIVRDLYNIYKASGKLSEFELESLTSAIKYLEYICSKNKWHLTEFVESNILNLFKTAQQYTCQCCDEKIEGLTCKSGHLNMFCSLTLTAIERDDYLVCKSCNSTARIELYEKNPTCIFCDLYLSNSY